MKTINIALLVSVIVIAGALVLPLSFSMANAADVCKFNKENQRCDLDIDKVTGGFKLSIVNEQNNGGGGNVSTVDQVARDGVAANGAADALNAAGDANVAGNVTALQSTVADLFKEIQGLKADIAVLNSSVITGISLSNGSAVVTPPEPIVCVPPAVDVDGVCVTPNPPLDNGTGNNGTGTNSTGNFTG